MSEVLETRSVLGPHAGQPVLQMMTGTEESAALILVHGRYATAEGMLPLAQALRPTDTLVVAPQAVGGTWYPHSFLAPLDQNEPHLSSALEFLEAVVETLNQRGIADSRILLLGFSQGACLALEYAARSARGLGGVVAFSGGLIGPPGTTFSYESPRPDLKVFLGCSDIDPHIPVERVHETHRVFEGLGSTVTTEIYPGMGHTISADELNHARRLLAALV